MYYFFSSLFLEIKQVRGFKIGAWYAVNKVKENIVFVSYMYLLFNYVFFFQFIISKKNVPLEDHQSIDSVTVVLTLMNLLPECFWCI